MDIKRLLDIEELKKIALNKQDILEYSKYDSGFLFYMFEKAGIVPPKENIPTINQGSITFLINNYDLNKTDLSKVNKTLYGNNRLIDKVKQEESLTFTKKEIKEMLLDSASSFPDVGVFLNFKEIEALITNAPRNHRYSSFKLDYINSCMESIPMSEVLHSTPEVFDFFMLNEDFIERLAENPELINDFVDKIVASDGDLSLKSFEILLNVGASPKLLEKISSPNIINNIYRWEPKFREKYPDFSVTDVFFSLNPDNRLRIISENPTKNFDYSVLSNTNFYNYNEYLHEGSIDLQVIKKFPKDFKAFWGIKTLAENRDILMEDVVRLAKEVVGLPQDKLFPIANNFIKTVQMRIDSNDVTSPSAAFKSIGIVAQECFNRDVMLVKPDDWVYKVIDDIDDSLNKAIYLTLINEPMSEKLKSSLDLDILKDLERLKIEPLPKTSRLFKEGFFKTDKPGYLNENMIFSLNDEEIVRYLKEGFLIEEKALNKFKNDTVNAYPFWLHSYVNSQKEAVPEFLKGCIVNNQNDNKSIEFLHSILESGDLYNHKNTVKNFIKLIDDKDSFFKDVLNKVQEINQRYVDGAEDYKQNEPTFMRTLLLVMDVFMSESKNTLEHYIKITEQAELRFHQGFIKDWIKDEKSASQKNILRSYLERNVHRDNFDVFSINQEMLFNYCKSGSVLNSLQLAKQVNVMVWLLMDGEELSSKANLIKETKNDLLFKEMRNFLITEKPEFVVNKKFDFKSWDFSVDEVLDAYKSFNDKTGMSWTTNPDDNHGEVLNYIITKLSSQSDGISKYLDLLENAKLQYPAFYVLLSDPNKVQSMFQDNEVLEDISLKIETFKESSEGKSLLNFQPRNVNKGDFDWSLAYAFSLIDLDSYIDGVQDLRRTYGNFAYETEYTETFKSPNAFINDVQYLLYLENDSAIYKSKEDVKVLFDKLLNQSVGNFYIFAERDKLIDYIGKDYVMEKVVQSVNTIKDFNDLFLHNIASKENLETGEVKSFQMNLPTYILDTELYQRLFEKVIDEKPEFRDYVVYLCEDVLTNSIYFTPEINKNDLNSFVKIINASDKSIPQIKASINNDFILEKISKVVNDTSEDDSCVSSPSFKL